MTTTECFGCGEFIPGGMQILGQYLCPACEAKLIRTRAEKSDYQNWIESCRRFWEKIGVNFKDLED